MGSNTKSPSSLMIEGEQVTITNVDKIIWPKMKINKYDYLHYLSVVAPHILPFLKDRLLTVIRFPNGVNKESFYQKNCPEYAPKYVETSTSQGIEYINCSNLPTFFWLGNQAAIEFHIPFQKIHSKNPNEIVLDLDPPSQSEFSLAVEAAIIIKEILDNFMLTSFIKTSGNKGLQIYIPLNEEFTYAETRIFTLFIAKFLETKYPNSFTTERLKKNRHKRLYVDFLQHGEGKTIIAPYSLRGNENALMATPLLWSEVTESLDPKMFPMDEAIKRIKRGVLPFEDFYKVTNKLSFKKVLEKIKEAGYV